MNVGQINEVSRSQIHVAAECEVDILSFIHSFTQPYFSFIYNWIFQLKPNKKMPSTHGLQKTTKENSVYNSFYLGNKRHQKQKFARSANCLYRHVKRICSSVCRTKNVYRAIENAIFCWGHWNLIHPPNWQLFIR